MATQVFLQDTNRPPLGDLPVSPVAIDDNQRDLMFPPWLDVLPTIPNHHGSSFQGNPVLNGTDLLPATERVHVYEDALNLGNTASQQAHQGEHQEANSHGFNPDTPPKTPENSNRRDITHAGKRKRSNQDDQCNNEANNAFKKPKSVKALQKSGMDSLKLHLLSLSPLQLAKLVSNLVESNPQFKQEIQSQLPEPDLTIQSQRLSQLMHNVYRALPRSRLASTRGALSYRQVRVHLSAFKICCMQQGRHLVRCQSWKAAMEYSLIAWHYTANLPVWDNPAHNKSRESCFHGLAAICMRALKYGQLDKQTLKNFRSRMQSASSADNVMELCVKRLDARLEDL